MYDVALAWAGDLSASPSGDILLVSDSDRSNQRIIRRLLTNQGDYLWDLSFGGGLALMIGSPIQPAEIEAVVRQQLLLDRSVARSPAPAVEVKSIDVAAGSFEVRISYEDSASGQSANLIIPSG